MSERHPSDQQPTLFDEPASQPAPDAPYIGRRRLRTPERHQVSWLCRSLDQMIPEDHEVRAIWEYVERLDLSCLVEQVEAVDGGPGHPAMDPRLGLALWLFAVLRGVVSARQLSELCREHLAFQWLCGEVTVNHHTLADFRTAHPEFLDQLLTHSVAVLMEAELVSMDRLADDGMRVRTAAGAGSFRRRPTLEQTLALATEQMAALKAEAEADPGASSRRQRAARERAAREKAERIEEALRQLPEVAAKKKKDERDDARCSTTDPDARVMKMADGGYRPAYNVEFSTDTASQVIVGVEVINIGSDHGQLAPMVEQLEERYDQRPKELLADNGFGKHEDIDTLAAGGTTVYMPVLKKKGIDEHEPQPGDSPAVAEWRRRMGSEEAQEIYRERASTAECVNAIARNRNLQQIPLRGLEKARTMALWYAILHNLQRAVTFGVPW